MAATNLELIENRRSELQAAFLAFGSVSEQLSGAFDSLRSQVAQLRAELGEAHAGKEHLAARLSALIKGLPGGVLVLDAGGEIQECNPARDRIAGRAAAGRAVRGGADARCDASTAAASASTPSCAAADSSISRGANCKAAAKWCC